MIQCPNCNSNNTAVLQTREREAAYLWRSRTCKDCGKNFSTREYALEELANLIDKDKANNDNPLYDLGHSLTLYKDYWGTYKAFSGNLKPIDVASYLTALCDRVGKFLQTTTAKGRGEYQTRNRRNYEYETPKHLLEDDCWLIDDFIEEWNNDDSNKCKFPTKPKEEVIK